MYRERERERERLWEWEQEKNKYAPPHAFHVRNASLHSYRLVFTADKKKTFFQEKKSWLSKILNG